MLRIRAFWAPDDMQAGEKFAEGHHNVLKEYGVTNVGSNSNDWIDDPFVYITTVEDIETNEVVGGARLHISHKGDMLPMEKAIVRVDKMVVQYIENLRVGGTAEVCGLWNSRKVEGKGIGGILLMRTSISLAAQLKLDTLLALAALHTKRKAMQKGYEIVSELGNAGTFNYPKLNLVATALIIKDTINLPNAKEIEKEQIFDLRNNPIQSRVEKWPRGTFDVSYDLKLDKTDWRAHIK